MNKLIASVGFAALGVSTLHAQYSPGLTSQEMAKPWSIAASLRGFYDDNYLTEPKAIAKSSYGFEVSPSAALNHSVDQTSFSLSYIFDLKWYETHSTTDTSHQFNAKLNHTFSEKYSMAVGDTVIIAQEPTVIDTTITSSPLRTSGNNLHNSGFISGTAALTGLLDLQANYRNDLYDYQQEFADVAQTILPAVIPSRAGLLNRMEQTASLNLDWKAMPDLTGVFGYQYEHVDYTSNEGIIFAPTGLPLTPGQVLFLSNIRNSDHHFLYVGADKDFNAQLHASIRAGGEYVDYYRAHQTTTSPYVDANMTWQYLPESYAQLGVKHVHSATDVVGINPGAAGSPVLDSETTAAYASISQKITPSFVGNFLGQYQHSSFNGGAGVGNSEDFYIAGINFAYTFSPYLLAEAGYNWNKLVSDSSARDYTRNVVYVGIRATY